MNKDYINKAEEQLGLIFLNKDLLEVALTHRSFSAETNKKIKVNERLEFLGDAVLEFVVTDFLYNQYTSLEEGDLAMLRANIVNSEVLAKLAEDIGLGECIFMGKGAELTGGRKQASILGDCLEAILGAIYLDRGIEEVKNFILKIFKNEIKKQASKEKYLDLKTNLQEYTMEKLKILPSYRIIQEKGPVHNKTFFAEVVVGGKVWGKGKGKSKKKAEQGAAKEALLRLQKLHG